MNQNLLKVIKQNLNTYLKSTPITSFLYVLLAFVLFSAVLLVNTINFNISNYFLNLFLSFVLTFIFIFAIFYVVCPILYACSLQNSEVSRFSNKKISLKAAFINYYNFNKNPFRIFNVFLFAILFSLLGSIVSNLIIILLEVSISPDMYSAYLNLTNDISSQEAFLETYGDLFYRYNSLYMSLSFVAPAIYVLYSLRKNESTFYVSNILLTDNKINTLSSQFTVLLRKGVISNVSKEHFQLDISVNYIGYIVLFIVYFGLSIGLLFIQGMAYEFIPFIAVIASLLLYVPFYVKERLFDILFYTAYSDLMLKRVSPSLRIILAQAKTAYYAKYDLNRETEEDEKASYQEVKENESSNKDNLNDSSKTQVKSKPLDKEAPKKGELDQEGIIDFTKSEDEDDSSNNKK